ncbi:MAG: hypothetical protein ACK4MJ_07360, partial [Hylemonella sp.]
MSSTAADWTRQPERGSVLLMRLIAWIGLRLGRRAARALRRGARAGEHDGRRRRAFGKDLRAAAEDEGRAADVRVALA